MLGSLLTSSVLGTITGILGNAITSYISYKTQQLKNNHELQMAELDIKAVVIEAREAAKIKRVEVEGEVEKSMNEALKKSYEFLNNNLFDKSYMKKLTEGKVGSFFAVLIAFMFGLVDFLKHLARPLITYYMLAVSTILTYMCYKLLIATKIGITAVQAFDLFQNVVMIIFYLTTTCVGWWFADRRVGKFMSRLNDGNTKEDDISIMNKFTQK